MKGLVPSRTMFNVNSFFYLPIDFNFKKYRSAIYSFLKKFGNHTKHHRRLVKEFNNIRKKQGKKAIPFLFDFYQSEKVVNFNNDFFSEQIAEYMKTNNIEQVKEEVPLEEKLVVPESLLEEEKELNVLVNKWSKTNFRRMQKKLAREKEHREFVQGKREKRREDERLSFKRRKSLRKIPQDMSYEYYESISPYTHISDEEVKESTVVDFDPVNSENHIVNDEAIIKEDLDSNVENNIINYEDDLSAQVVKPVFKEFPEVEISSFSVKPVIVEMPKVEVASFVKVKSDVTPIVHSEHRKGKVRQKYTKEETKKFRLKMSKLKEQKKIDRALRKAGSMNTSVKPIIAVTESYESEGFMQEMCSFDNYDVKWYNSDDDDEVVEFDAVNCDNIEFEGLRENNVDSQISDTDLSDIQCLAESISDSVGSMKTATTLIVGFYQLYRARSTLDYLAAFHQVFATWNLSIPFDQLKKCVKSIYRYLQKWNISKCETEAASEEVFRVQEMFTSLMSSSLVGRLRDIVVQMAAMKWFNKTAGITILRYLGHPKENMSYLDFVHLLFDSIHKLCVFSEGIRSGIPIADALFSKDPMHYASQRVRYLIQAQELTYSGVPVPGCVEESVYLEDLRANLCVLEEGVKVLRPFDSNTTVIKDLVTKGRVLLNKRMNDRSGRNRTTPFALLVTGEPGTGKSGMIMYWCNLWSTIKGREFNEHHVYTKTNGSLFWEGYDPYSHRIVRFSEVAKFSRNFVMQRGQPEFDELLSVVDCLQYNVDMAFEGKGKTSISCEFVIADTNNDSLNVKDIYFKPEAYMRRFTFIEQKVMSEFRKANSKRIDSQKAFSAEGHPLDRFLFSIYRVEKNVKQYIREDIRLEEATQVMESLFRDHILNESRYKDAVVNAGLLRSFPEAGLYDFAEEPHLPNPVIRSDLLEVPLVSVSSESGEIKEPKKSGNAFVKVAKAYALVLFMSATWSLFSCVTSYFGRICKQLGFYYIASFLDCESKDSEIPVKLNFLPLFISSCLFFGGIPFLPGLFLFCGFINPFWVCSKVSPYLFKGFKEKCEIHACRARDYLLYLFYLKPFNPFVTKSGRIKLFKSCVAAIAVLLLFLKRKTLKQILFPTRAETENAVFNDILDNTLREKYSCGSTMKRVPVNGASYWNDMISRTPPVFTGPYSQLYDLAKKQTRYVHVKLDNILHTHILGVRGTYALINEHALGGREEVDIEISNSSGIHIQGSGWTPCKLVRDMCVKVAPDILMFDTLSVGFKDLYKHFINEIVEGNYGGRFANEDIRFDVKKIYAKIVDKNVGRVDLEYGCEYTFPTHMKGMCGLPVVGACGSGASVYGIHCAGQTDGDIGYAAIVTKKDLEVAFAELAKLTGVFSFHSESYESSSKKVQYASFVEDIDFEEPGVKSVTRFRPVQNIGYLGKTVGPIIMESGSKLKKTKIFDAMSDFVKDKLDWSDLTEFHPPMMRPRWREDIYVCPYNNTMDKLCKPKKCLNPRVMKEVIDLLSDDFITLLKEKGLEKLEPLSVEQAINGVKDDYLSRRINASAGAGYGFPGKKWDHLPLMDDVTRIPTEELAKRILDCLDRYAEGRRCHFVFEVKLKDEPREKNKVLNGQTRAFYMSPLDMLILFKMFLQPLFTLFMEHPDIFNMAIGINMHVGADKLYKKLSEHSGQILEGDFKSFDTSQPIGLSQMVSAIVYNVLKAFGYNESALNVVKGLLTDRAFPYIHMLKDMFLIHGLIPSGAGGTAELNSLGLNCLYIYFWLVEFKKKYGTNWRKYLIMVFYGDDSLIATILQGFNAIAFAKFCDEHYGMTFTSSSKGDVSNPFVTPETMSFLKRNFRWSDTHERYVAPLAQSSILRSLQWSIPSTSISEEEQVISSAQSAVWEMAIGYPEQASEFRDFVLREICCKYGVPMSKLKSCLPTPESIANRVFPKSEDLFVSESGEFDDIPVLREKMQALAKRVAEHPEYATVYNTGRPIRSVLNDPTIRVSVSFRRLLSEFRDAQCTLNLLSRRRGLFTTETGEDDFESLFYAVRLVVENRGEPHSHQDYQENITSFAEVIFAHPLTLNVFFGLSHYKEILRDDSVDLPEYYILLVREWEKAKFNYENFLCRFHGKVHTESGELESGIPDSKETDETVQMISLGEEASSGISMFPSTGQDSIYAIENFLSRPVLLFQYILLEDTPLKFDLNIWNEWSFSPSVRAKLRNFAFIRGNMHVRINVVANPFNSGRLLFSYQPDSVNNSNLNALLTLYDTEPLFLPLINNYLSQAPGALIYDIKANKTVDIVCPFISTKPAYRLYNSAPGVISDVTPYEDFDHAGEFFITSLVPIHSVSTTVSDVYLTIYGWMSEVELGCPTATEIEVSTEAGEFDTGPIERISSTMAQISSALKVIPQITPIARASEMIFSGLGTIASLFGWSRPPLIDDPLIVKNQPFQNGAQTIGTETTYRVTLDPKQEITVDPRVVAVEEDDMAIQAITSRFTYLTGIRWGSQVPFTAIWSCRVTPRLETIFVDGAHIFCQPTAMSFAAKTFVYWNGTIDFWFDVTCSAFHRGKIGIMFDPNVNQYLIIRSSLEMNKNNILIVDIQETQSFKVSVEWAAPRQWCVMPPGSNDLYGDDFNVTSPYWSNGFIMVFPFTSLQSPDDSSVTINVFVGSEDMRFNQVNNRLLPIQRFVDISEFKVETESGLVFTDEVPKYVLNKSTADLSVCSTFHFGEQPISFRALLKRYVMTDSFHYQTTGASGSIIVTDQNFPVANLPYGNTAQADPRANSLFDYLRYAYIGARGGLRKRVRFVNFGIMNTLSQVKVSIGVPSTPVSLGITSQALPVPNTLNGTVTFAPVSNAGIEYEMPYYSGNLFWLSFADDMTGTNYTDESLTFWNKVSYISVEVEGDYDARIDIETAAGEDFSFLRFQGAPFYTEDYP